MKNEFYVNPLKSRSAKTAGNSVIPIKLPSLRINSHLSLILLTLLHNLEKSSWPKPKIFSQISVNIRVITSDAIHQKHFFIFAFALGTNHFFHVVVIGV